MIQALKNKKIGVINGGKSFEKSISKKSGINVYNALITLGYDAVLIDPATDNILDHSIDLAFIALHGKGGEDGEIQGWLEFHQILYTGSGIAASAIGMNKKLTKQMIKAVGLPYLPSCIVDKATLSQPMHLTLPIIAKPIYEGSSLGVEVFDTTAEYEKKIPSIVAEFGPCLVEEFITGREITVGLLERNHQLAALPILELVPKNRFYDFEAKYTHGMTDFILPARLSEEETKRCQKDAITLHNAIGCKGYSRVDMIVHETKGPFILEINTLPGMTDLSDLPAAAKHIGLSFEELVEEILKSAL